MLYLASYIPDFPAFDCDMVPLEYNFFCLFQKSFLSLYRSKVTPLIIAMLLTQDRYVNRQEKRVPFLASNYLFLQTRVYQETCDSLVQKALLGVNVSILALGAVSTSIAYDNHLLV
jgi:hypothetical protein